MVDILPRQGTPDTLFQRLCDYVAAIDPTWPARIRPIDAGLFQRYLHMSGRGTDPSSLPESFRQTALAMGGNAGGLFRNVQIDTNLENIVSLYEDYQRFDPQAINPALPIVARYSIGDQVALDMRTDAEPPVVNTSNGAFVESCARSWEAFVMQAALCYCEPRRLPAACWCSSSPNEIKTALGGSAAAAAVIDAFATREGLTIAWPSDDHVRIAVNQSSSIFARVRKNAGVLIYAFSAQNTFLHRVGAHLASALGSSTGGALRLIDGVLLDSTP